MISLLLSSRKRNYSVIHLRTDKEGRVDESEILLQSMNLKQDVYEIYDFDTLDQVLGHIGETGPFHSILAGTVSDGEGMWIKDSTGTDTERSIWRDIFRDLPGEKSEWSNYNRFAVSHDLDETQSLATQINGSLPQMESDTPLE